MKANTAVCFILAGVSLGLQTQNRPNLHTIRIAKGCAIAVGAIGLLTLGEYLLDWNLGIDQLLFQDRASPATPYPGRMGDNTALNFTLLGLALWFRGKRTCRSDAVAQTATLSAAAIALLALVGYAYNIQVFYRFIFYSTSMAIHAALTFLVLCCGILASRTDYSVWKTLTGDQTGSSIARRLIPIAIAVPFCLGWLILYGLRANLYDAGFSLALLVISLILTLAIVILRNAQQLNQIDDERKRTQGDEQFLNDLDRQLRQMSDPDAMSWYAVESLGNYLQVDRCLWDYVDTVAGVMIVEQDWRQPGTPSVVGTYAITDLLLPEMVEQFEAGHSAVVSDILTCPYTAPFAENFRALKIRAFVGVPCIYEGRWVATLSVTEQTARNWQSAEVTLLQEVVARLWSVIEQTRATQALSKSEARFRRLAANIPGVIYQYVVHSDGADAFTYVSDRSREIYEYEPEELLQDFGLVWQMIHPDDVDRVSAANTLSAQQLTLFDTELRIIPPSGRLKWIHVTSVPQRQTSDNRVVWDGIVIDITDYKQAEAELQERSAHIQLLYETTRDLLSADHPLTLVEALFAKLKPLVGLDVYFNYMLHEEQQILHLEFYGGISEETAREIEWLEVGHAVCGTVAQQRCQIVQTDLQHSNDPKAELVRALGLTAYSCQPLLAQGQLFGTLGFGSRSRVEFTLAETQLFQALCDQIAIALERSKLVASLQQQTEDLTQANRLKDEFLAALSHELRTPLNPILGWTTMLKEHRLTATKTAEALDTIDRNVKQQIRLVDDLLDVSCIIQGKLKLDLRPVDLVQVIQNAIEAVQFSAQAKGITIALQGLPSLNLVADCDRLQQVFWNLLSNAVKFTPEQGRVEIDISVENTNCCVRVADTGIGIEPKDLPYVFDRFRQVDGGSTRHYGGLGLGLAIVRQLIELHGGMVVAESPGIGRGATFAAKLPIRTEGLTVNDKPFSIPELNFSRTVQHNQVAQAQLSSTAAIAGVRILIVEDDPDNLDLIQFLLEQDGATVTAEISPLKAIELVSRQPFDLIISDIGMSELDGYELIQRIRALPQSQHIPALALTAFVYQNDRKNGMQAGFQAYITKPVNPIELVEALTQLLTCSSSNLI